GVVDRNHVVTLRELHALTAPAYVALWEHVAAHDLAHTIIRKNAPIDDPLFHMLQEPRRLHATVHDNILLRIVDVAPALSTRRYAESGAATFELVDDRCEWNRGTWRLEADGEHGELTRSSAAPDFTLDARALSALASGARSATDLYRQGGLETSRPESLRAWDRLFETAYRPHCPDKF
ncbi:MAG: sterol carrier protein domain-containing protein, partial [Chloroflexota bacterium]|nr:sterol carrier protein domain-containing protein [Chloroflexota bacterium]